MRGGAEAATLGNFLKCQVGGDEKLDSLVNTLFKQQFVHGIPGVLLNDPIKITGIVTESSGESQIRDRLKTMLGKIFVDLCGGTFAFSNQRKTARKVKNYTGKHKLGASLAKQLFGLVFFNEDSYVFCYARPYDFKEW